MKQMIIPPKEKNNDNSIRFESDRWIGTVRITNGIKNQSYKRLASLDLIAHVSVLIPIKSRIQGSNQSWRMFKKKNEYSGIKSESKNVQREKREL